MFAVLQLCGTKSECPTLPEYEQKTQTGLTLCLQQEIIKTAGTEGLNLFVRRLVRQLATLPPSSLMSPISLPFLSLVSRSLFTHPLCITFWSFVFSSR